MQSTKPLKKPQGQSKRRSGTVLSPLHALLLYALNGILFFLIISFDLDMFGRMKE